MCGTNNLTFYLICPAKGKSSKANKRQPSELELNLAAKVRKKKDTTLIFIQFLFSIH
jgi:hypothetical protein